MVGSGEAGADGVETFRVVGQRDEVQGRLQLRYEPAGQLDRFAAREPVRLTRTDAVAAGVGVGRPTRVHVQVAEERLTVRVDANVVAGFRPGLRESLASP